MRSLDQPRFTVNLGCAGMERQHGLADQKLGRERRHGAVHGPDFVDIGAEGMGERAGGLEGGVTNGADLVVRAFFKPISTLRRGLPSIDLATGEAGATAWERSDVTAIGAAPVIVESMLALVLADELLVKLGGDAIVDTDAAWAALCARLAPWWRPKF